MNERKYIQTLTEVCCRWPIGDPQQADFHFCGKKKVAGLPYCEVHARRAFQPPQPRRRDREVFEPAMPMVAAVTAPIAAEPAAERAAGQGKAHRLRRKRFVKEGVGKAAGRRPGALRGCAPGLLVFGGPSRHRRH